MTSLGIITDVHADVHAVQDALAQLERLECELVVCAGDIVDYGLFPEETIALLAQRKIPCIRGNHDRWAVARDRGEIRDLSGWDLSRAAIRFLEQLPLSWSASIDGVRIAVHHGSPGSDMRGVDPGQCTRQDALRLLADANADVLLVGHTHEAFAMRVEGERLIANPGALLTSPADDSAMLARLGGTFGVLELPSKRFSVRRAKDGAEIEIPRRAV